MVAICCKLVVLWLRLEYERPRKKHRITSLLDDVWVKKFLSSTTPQSHENLQMDSKYFGTLHDTFKYCNLLQSRHILLIDEQISIFFTYIGTKCY